MSQLVSQTVTYGLDGNAFSISTHGTNGVLRIMAGNPYASNTVPIIDINSDKSVHFYGQINADIDGVAERARCDENGANIVATYATKTAINELAPKNAPTFTGVVTIPTPATSDNSTKAASTAFVNSFVNGKGFITADTADTKYLGIKAQAESAKTAVDAVKKSGNRAALAGYETISSSSNAITINATSADDQICTGAVTITVSDGSNGQTWQKNVTITNAGATISPGSKWKWVGGKAPELKANSVLVCKWVGVFGILSLITTE